MHFIQNLGTSRRMFTFVQHRDRKQYNLDFIRVTRTSKNTSFDITYAIILIIDIVRLHSP